MPRKQASNTPDTISGQLRAALAADGRSVYLLGELAGIDRGNLCRFAAGRSGISLVAVDRLAAVLGCVLVVDEERRG